MQKGNKLILAKLLLASIFLVLAIQTNLADTKTPLSLSADAKKLKRATQSLYSAQTRKQGLKDLWKLANLGKRKKVDRKFVTGCKAMGILSRASRNAVGYETDKHDRFLPPIADFKEETPLDKKEISKINKLLEPFDDYATISNWSYQKKSPEKFSNPRLLPFIELAYLKAIEGKENSSLKNSLKMLTYAESHAEGLDKAETLCQFGELMRELKEFRRAETYLNNALQYGNQWFKRDKISENSNEHKILPGTAEWKKLKARIERLLFLLSFDLLEIDYGEAYSTYVKMRSFIAKEEWWLAFPLAIKLKDEYPATVYGKYGRLSWCRMLLGNDKAEEMRDKSLPSGVKELEKFISGKPRYKLYHGAAIMELGKFHLEYKCDSKQASKYYNRALEWFREIRKHRDLIDLYSVPAKVTNISAPRGKLSNINQWRQIEYRKPDPKEIINSNTAPDFYISENEKKCLFMVGFFYFVDGKYEEAKKYFEQVKEVDANIAKLVSLNWPNVYWRLISACNVKRMLFPAEDKKHLKGKNKLLVAYAELNYLCEKFGTAKVIFQDILNTKNLTDKEKAIVLLGISCCESSFKEEDIKLYDKVIKLAGNSHIAGTALFKKGCAFCSVGWENRLENAEKCFASYIKRYPQGPYIKEAQFRQMLMLLMMDNKKEAMRLFKKYDFERKYPNSGFTRGLLRRFAENKKEIVL